jgi:AcrR family transcriptional regulator
MRLETMRRAYRPDEKSIRREAILAGARELFLAHTFAQLRMTDLAQCLGLGKGTLYLYFRTKEALFLAVLQTELEAWFAAAVGWLDAHPRGEPAQVARGLAAELLRRPLLPKLQALLHGVLEQNVPMAEARAFARFLQGGVERVGARLERVLPGLAAGDGALYLLRFHGLVIGCQTMASRPPELRAALSDPDMALFDFGFEDVLCGAVVDLLQGMLARVPADAVPVG